jgi:hypothetical protein
MPIDPIKAKEQWQRYEYCRDNGHHDFILKADKCEDFFAGLQWKPEDLELLKSQRRPALTINKIISTIGTILGEQIQNRAEVLFRPKNGSPAEIAEALTKVWMYIAQENQLPWVRSDVFCDGIVRSRGFYDVRMKFDDSMQGEVEIAMLNSKNVVIDCDGEEYDPDKWNDIYITKWMNGQDISVLYNEEDAKYLAENVSAQTFGLDSIESRRDSFAGKKRLIGNYNTEDLDMVTRKIRVLERQYRKLDKQLHFVDIQTGDMRPVPNDWDRNRIAALIEKAAGRISTTKKLVKRIRWCVTADNLVLHDEWSPYKHFTPVPYFPYFRYGNTIGIVENLLGPQEILNKASSQELHVINTTANSGWVVEAGSIVNMSIEELEAKGAQTGLVLEYAKGADAPVKITPNQTPTGLDRVTYKAEEHIKTISNVSDSMQGFDREDVAAKAIAYKQQRGSVNLTKVLDNLERTDYILARNVLDLIQNFYTEPRILNITHEDLTREPEQIEVNQPDPVTGAIVNDLMLGEYNITITSTPYRSSIEDSQFEQARALREIGVPIPDNILIENSRLMRRAEIVKQMAGDKESPEAQAAAQLEQRAKEAEVAGMEADAQLKGAQAAKTAAEAQGGGQAELQKMAAELQMEQQKMNAELEKKYAEMQMKMEEMAAKLQMQREEHQQNLAIKQEEAAQNAQIREQDAAMKRAQMLRQSAEQGSEPSNPTA